MAQTVLPDNVARPFFTLFALVLPQSVCRHDMWQKKAEGHSTGLTLRKMVLPDNVASGFLHRL
jgi:hypothetical protein